MPCCPTRSGRPCARILLLGVATALSACAPPYSGKVIRLVDGKPEKTRFVTPCAYESYIRAQIAIERGQLRRAEWFLGRALDTDGESPYLHSLLATVLFRRGSIKEAHEHLDEALKLEPGYAWALVMRARMHYKGGKKARAAAALRACIRHNAGYAPCYTMYAQILERAAHPREARAVLRRLVRKVKDPGSGHRRLAELCLRLMDLPCAARHYTSALRSKPEMEVLARLAQVKLALGHTGQGIRLLREAFDRTGGKLEVAAVLLQVLFHEGRAREVDDLLQILRDAGQTTTQEVARLADLALTVRRGELALDLLSAAGVDRGSVPAQLCVLRASALAVAGREKEARELLAAELEGAEGPRAALALARLQERGGDLPLASDTLRRALARQPGHEDLLQALSGSLHLQGRITESVQVVRDALARRPDSPTLRFQLAVSLERAGQWRQAVAEMKRYAGRRPGDASAHNFIGVALVEHGGDLQEAERRIRRAMYLMPGYGFIIDSLGWLQHRRGELERARTTLEMASRLSPGDAEILGHLAEVSAAQKRISAAAALLRRAISVSEDPGLTARLRGRLNELQRGRVGRGTPAPPDADRTESKPREPASRPGL